MAPGCSEDLAVLLFVVANPASVDRVGSWEAGVDPVMAGSGVAGGPKEEHLVSQQRSGGNGTTFEPLRRERKQVSSAASIAP